jgi:hypothetical protein
MSILTLTTATYGIIPNGLLPGNYGTLQVKDAIINCMYMIIWHHRSYINLKRPCKVRAIFLKFQCCKYVYGSETEINDPALFKHVLPSTSEIQVSVTPATGCSVGKGVSYTVPHALLKQSSALIRGTYSFPSSLMSIYNSQTPFLPHSAGGGIVL